MSHQVRYKDQVAYPDAVLLPQLERIHNMFSRGRFGRNTWNMIVDLLGRCPKEVKKKVDLSLCMEAENNKQMCLILFYQIRENLEDNGILMNKSTFQRGEL